MNFDDLKASFLEQFDDLKNKITESATYNSIKEQYQGFPPHIQKVIVIALVALTAIGLISIPYSSITESQNYEVEFSEKRQTIRDLFKYGKAQSGQAPLPSEIEASSIISSIKGSLNSVQLLPEQMGSMRTVEKPEINLVRPPIIQTDVTASFKWLNISQVVDISYKLQKLNRHTKLTGVNMTAASEDDRKDYFNVTYTLSSFSFPQKKENNTKSKKKRR